MAEGIGASVGGGAGARMNDALNGLKDALREFSNGDKKDGLNLEQEMAKRAQNMMQSIASNNELPMQPQGQVVDQGASVAGINGIEGSEISYLA